MEKEEEDSAVLDMLDMKILKEFYFLKSNQEVKLWTIHDRIFPDCKNRRDKMKNYNLLKLRMKKMNPDLFFIEKDRKTGNNEYILVSDNVWFGKHKFRGNKERDSILVCINGSWSAFEITVIC